MIHDRFNSGYIDYQNLLSKKTRRQSPVRFERRLTHRYISYQNFLETNYSNKKKLGDNRLAIHVLVDSRYIDYQNYYQKETHRQSPVRFERSITVKLVIKTSSRLTTQTKNPETIES